MVLSPVESNNARKRWPPLWACGFCLSPTEDAASAQPVFGLDEEDHIQVVHRRASFFFMVVT